MAYYVDCYRDGTGIPGYAPPPANPADAGRLAPRASIDAARTTDENKRHWANADALGPNAAFSETVRQKLRDRGRYESLNSSYCRGLTRSLAYDLIGTGPRPQLGIPGDTDGSHAKRVEAAYRRWARAIGLGRKYRIAEKSVVTAGEVFGVLFTNDRSRNRVKLDLRLIEAEQCTSPWGMMSNPRLIDGILYDAMMNPVDYYFLRQHPGENTFPGSTAANSWERIAASQVIHFYEIDRPSQGRGIPKLTAGLPLFAQGRRIRLATLTAMEVAAMLSGIMKTSLPPETGAAATVDNWNLFELVRGTLLTLPQGWEASQFNPTQPSQNAESFARDTLGEAGRGPGAPLNVVSGNSSLYNFSSGRLDHVPYQHGLRIDRDDLELIACDRVFLAWEAEARAASVVEPSLAPVDEWVLEWQWDGFGTIDPVKEANADDIRLANGSASLADVLGEDGKDWQDHIDRLAAEKAYAESKGLQWPLSKAAATPSSGAPANENAELSSLEQMVQMAMDDAGVKESQADEIIAALQPTFSQMRNGKPSRNGVHRTNGV